jgi:quercetin dioxygenase-like cupin family protein
MSEPSVVHEQERDEERWPGDEAGGSWKTLISGGLTPSESLTLGIARLGPGEILHTHRHAQPEVYLVLAGSGVVTVAGEASDVRAGSAVFIPGNALHSLEAAGEELRLAYAFAADSMDDVEYHFVTSGD